MATINHHSTATPSLYTHRWYGIWANPIKVLGLYLQEISIKRGVVGSRSHQYGIGCHIFPNNKPLLLHPPNLITQY